MSKSGQIDRSGKFWAHALNSQPTAERKTKATYVPHLGTLIVEQDQSVRKQIFEENRKLYNESRLRASILKRPETAGGYPMRIPEIDLQELKKKYPEARADAPKEERMKFYIKLYKDHPEYRVG